MNTTLLAGAASAAFATVDGVQADVASIIVEVSNNGADFSSNSVQFRYMPRVNVSSFAPLGGSASGGTRITLRLTPEVGAIAALGASPYCRFGRAGELPGAAGSTAMQMKLSSSALIVPGTLISGSAIECSSPPWTPRGSTVQLEVSSVALLHEVQRVVVTSTPAAGKAALSGAPHFTLTMPEESSAFSQAAFVPIAFDANASSLRAALLRSVPTLIDVVVRAPTATPSSGGRSWDITFVGRTLDLPPLVGAVGVVNNGGTALVAPSGAAEGEGYTIDVFELRAGSMSGFVAAGGVIQTPVVALSVRGAAPQPEVQQVILSHTTATAEVQTVALAAMSGGYTYTLSVAGGTSSALAPSATATDIELALWALPGILPGGVIVDTVTQTGSTAHTFAVTFKRELGDIGTIVVAYIGTGGSPSESVTTGVSGGLAATGTVVLGYAPGSDAVSRGVSPLAVTSALAVDASAEAVRAALQTVAYSDLGPNSVQVIRILNASHAQLICCRAESERGEDARRRGTALRSSRIAV
jgi:hypothetical protein